MNESFIPRCWECGHPADFHHEPTKRHPEPAGCYGRWEPCDCKGWVDSDPPRSRDVENAKRS